MQRVAYNPFLRALLRTILKKVVPQQIKKKFLFLLCKSNALFPIKNFIFVNFSISIIDLPIKVVSFVMYRFESIISGIDSTYINHFIRSLSMFLDSY